MRSVDLSKNWTRVYCAGANIRVRLATFRVVFLRWHPCAGNQPFFGSRKTSERFRSEREHKVNSRGEARAASSARGSESFSLAWRQRPRGERSFFYTFFFPPLGGREGGKRGPRFVRRSRILSCDYAKTMDTCESGVRCDSRFFQRSGLTLQETRHSSSGSEL